MTKRAQLSIETMIIYGLVILVALSVVGALIYFNVLDLGSYLPDTCNLGGTGDLKCEEMRFDAGTTDTDPDTNGVIALGIRNVGQKPIQLLKVSAVDEDGIHFSDTISGEGYLGPVDVESNKISSSNTLAPGEIALVEIDIGKVGQPGRVLRGSLTTEYQFSGGVVVQEAAGDIRIKAT